MELTFIYVGLFFIVIGVLIKQFKLYFLIAGYNTMSKVEKEKIKIEKVATLMRNVFVVMGFFIISGTLIAYFTEIHEILDYVFYITMGVGLLTILIRSNSSAYKK